MNLDDLEAQVLGHTRKEMAPRPEDAGRVRQALVAQLGTAALGTAATAGATSSFWASLGPIKTTLLFVAAIGGGGVVVGLSVRGDEVPSSAAPAAAPNQVASARHEMPAHPSSALEKSASAPATTPRDQPSSRRSEPAPPVGAKSEQLNRLAEEVRLLRRADQALRQGAPEVARHLLDELSTTHPNGQLLEERAATKALLLCQRTRDAAARAAGREFISAHPKSVYAARVRAACIDAPGE